MFARASAILASLSLAFAIVAACAPAPPARSAVAVASASSSEPLGPGPTVCSKFDPFRRASIDDQCRAQLHIPFGGASDDEMCLLSGRGAWTLSIAAAPHEPCPPDGARGTFVIGHVDASGVVAALPSEPFESLPPYPNARVVHWPRRPEGYAPEGLFDYDGDGEAEIFVWREQMIDSAFVRYSGRVLTYARGTIVDYEATKALPLVGMGAMDADNRPDLFYVWPDDRRLMPDGSYPAAAGTIERFWLGAHSLPGGGFSTDDHVALAYASRACPKRPEPLDANDLELSLLAKVRCARLRGVDTANLLRQIGVACPRARLPQSSGAPGECWNHDALVEWASARPPFVLR